MKFQERARYVIAQEAEAIRSISPLLIDEALTTLAVVIFHCKGKVVTTGIGKNGFVARRVAATFSCTGTPAYFLHSGESLHGDFGVISRGDLIFAFSNSGKTQEIIETVEKVREVHGDGVKIAAITSYPDSPLASISDIIIAYGEIIEPCPLGLTPSSSLAVMSVLADALALGVMEMRGFTIAAYGHNHHAGYIAKKIARLKENELAHDIPASSSLTDS